LGRFLGSDFRHQFDSGRDAGQREENPMNALPYALIAQAAYSDPPDIGRADTAARAIKTVNADGLIVTFPGTSNLACWLADLDVSVVGVEGLGTLHEGFWNALGEIEADLLALDPDVTCGHSEGGALAILYAAVLCLDGRPPKAVYAFEPPRVSVDNTLASLLTQHGVQLLLTQNGEDVVPLVPRLLHDWQHPGPLTRIGKASEPFPNVEDHLIENVIRALQG